MYISVVFFFMVSWYPCMCWLVFTIVSFIHTHNWITMCIPAGPSGVSKDAINKRISLFDIMVWLKCILVWYLYFMVSWYPCMCWLVFTIVSFIHTHNWISMCIPAGLPCGIIIGKFLVTRDNRLMVYKFYIESNRGI